MLQANRLYKRKVEKKKEEGEDGGDMEPEMDEPELEEEMEDEKDDDDKKDDQAIELEKKDDDNKENQNIDKSIKEDDKKLNNNEEDEEDDEKEKEKEQPKEKTQSSFFIDKQDQIDVEEKEFRDREELEAKNLKLKKKREKEERKAKKKAEKEIAKQRRKMRKEFKLLFPWKKLFPESVISIGFKSNVSLDMNLSKSTTLNSLQDKTIDSKTDIKIRNPFWEVEAFFQENGIEVLNCINEKNKDEIMEIMRIYIERNGRPYNYFNDNETKILNKRDNLLEQKNVQRQKDEKKEQEKLNLENTKKESEFWEKMEARISEIKQAEKEIQEANDSNTRKFLLKIMPILTKGMLEVCKVDPIDPIDYLAQYLFDKSTG